MKIGSIFFLTLLSGANASSLRGEAVEEGPIDQLACTIKGGTSQNTCDDTKSEDGSQCVWCSFASYGVCVSDAVASEMKQTIPGINCDGSGGSDDDDVADDDASTDDASGDDSVPDDYWECIEKYKNSSECISAGCAWCDNKGGYGVCMDMEQATSFDDSDWYSCKMPSLTGSDPHSLPVNDPSDATCVAATIGGDQACKATLDSDGKACDWCAFQGYDFCLNGEQAEFASQIGASCDDRVNEETNPAKDLIDKVADPSDPTCLAATLSGDESTCESTQDIDGNPCDWCSFQGYDMCLNDDQADIAEQLGASCGGGAMEQRTTAEELMKKLADPSDPTCLAATLSDDESTCEGTKDADGNPCDWCSFQGYDMCLNDDQADIAEQFGASCNGKDIVEVPTETLSDPSDPSCLFVTIVGDESDCRGSTDVDGNPCEWCSLQTFDFCLNVDQAGVLEQLGASCDEEHQSEEDLSDPNDPSCLVATLGGDESTCKSVMDSDGKPCEWCSFQNFDLCLNDDQAAVIGQFGASCGDARERPDGGISASIA